MLRPAAELFDIFGRGKVKVSRPSLPVGEGETAEHDHRRRDREVVGGKQLVKRNINSPYLPVKYALHLLAGSGFRAVCETFQQFFQPQTAA